MLQLGSLFPQPPLRRCSEQGANALADVATALVYSLLDLKIDGLVESMLNFLIQIHSAQVNFCRAVFLDVLCNELLLLSCHDYLV